MVLPEGRKFEIPSVEGQCDRWINLIWPAKIAMQSSEKGTTAM